MRLTSLCYKSQTWTLTKEYKRNIISCQKRCVRKGVNKVRRDPYTNGDIRSDVEILPIKEFVDGQKLSFGHLVRMSSTLPDVGAYNMTIETSRSRGRPRR